MGNTVVLSDEIEKIRGIAELRTDYSDMLERAGDRPDHLRCGLWCWKRGLRTEARSHFLSVVKARPGNRTARWALGQVKVKGIWIEAGVWTAVPGEKRAWMRWRPDLGKLQIRQGAPPANDAHTLIRTSLRAAPEARRQAAADFARLPRKQRREGLLLALSDRSSRVREFAARKIGPLGGKDIQTPLARLALVDPFPKVRQAALASLKDGAYPQARNLLIKGLTSKNFAVRLHAIRGLVSFPAFDSIDALTGMMSSSQTFLPRVNIFVGRQSSYVRDFDVEVASFAGIGDPVMGRLNEGSVLDVKILAVEIRQYRFLRRSAWHALCSIAGKNLGSDAEVWRRWARETFGKS